MPNVLLITAVVYKIYIICVYLIFELVTRTKDNKFKHVQKELKL